MRVRVAVRDCADEAGKTADGNVKKVKMNPMADDRFSRMFTDKEFQIDEMSHEYGLLHPNAKQVRPRRFRQSLLSHPQCLA